MTHGEAAHERGTHNMFTGYRPRPRSSSLASAPSSRTSRARATTCRPTSACRTCRMTFAGTGYMSSAYGPFSLGGDPADKGFTVRDLNHAQRRRRQALRPPPQPAGHGGRAFPHAGEVRLPRRDGQLLPGGLRAHQFSRRPARPSTSPPSPTACRDEYGRNDRRSAHADGPPPRRGRRALRLHDLRRLGHPRQHPGRHHTASCRTSTRPSPRSSPISTSAACSTRRSSWSRPSSAARRRSTATLAATTGRAFSPSSSPAVGSSAGTSTARPTRPAPNPTEDPLTVENMATTVYHQLGIAPEKKLDRAGEPPDRHRPQWHCRFRAAGLSSASATSTAATPGNRIGGGSASPAECGAHCSGPKIDSITPLRRKATRSRSSGGEEACARAAPA